MKDVGIVAILLAVVVLAMLANAKKKGGWLNASSFVFVYYTISFVCALIMALTTKDLLGVYPTILFSVGIFAVLWPILSIKETKLNSVGYKAGPNSIKSLELMSVGLAVIGIFLFFFYLRYVPQVFSGDISARRIEMVTKGDVLVVSSLGRLASFLSAFYLLSMVLAFYRIALRKKITWIEVGMFMGTLAEVFHIFSQFGRDGVVFWIVSCVLNIMLFWSFLGKNLKRQVATVAGSFIGLFLAGFLAITVSRFAHHKTFTLEGSVVSYFGQHVHNYGDVYRLSDQIQTDGYLSFPLYRGFTEGLSSARNKQKSYGEEVETLYRIEGKPSGVFASFLREWTFDFGVYGALALAGVCGVVFNFFMKRGVDGFSLSKIILYNLYCLFLFQGVFYFRFKFVYGNFMILSMVAVFLVMWYRERSYTLFRSKGISWK